MTQMNIPFKNFQSAEARNRFEKTQQHIVEQILLSDKKVIAVNAPTGNGKSLIGMIAGHNLANRTTYVCSKKDLQDQLHHDFPEAKILKGRRNYICNLYKYLKADSCLKKCNEYKETDMPCNYYDAKEKVLASKYRILNTHYFLYEANYARSFSNQEIVIIDEADTLDNILVNFVCLFVSEPQIAKYGLKLPKYITKYDAWFEWAHNAWKRLKPNYNPNIAGNCLDKEYVQDVMFVRKLELFLKLVDESWLFDHSCKGWSFKPVWLTPEITSQYLWSHAEKFILMSATLPPKPILCSLIGLDQSDMDYIEVSSPYPVENRYIHYRPIIAMSYKNQHEHYRVINEVEKLANKYDNVKGVIHTVSYKLRNKIMEIDNDRFITHDSDDKDEMFKIFKESEDPVIWVSPSSERGLDLVDGLARFIIIPKVPFGNLGDKCISARCYSGKFGSKWFASEAAQSIVQGCGRGVRHENDWCHTYILDKQFDRLMEYFSKWFKEAIIIE